MSDMQAVRDAMCDLPKLVEGINAVVQKNADEWPQDDKFTSFYRKAIPKHYHHAAEIICATAESPIEKMLFNSMVLGCALCDPFGLVVKKGGGDDTLAWLGEFRSAYAATRQVQQMAKAAKRDAGSVNRYVEWLVTEKGMSEDEAAYWRSMDIGAALFGNALHLVPQATLKGLGPKGKAIRVDALVYVPNRPKFLVAVECDGYEWHGNKDSFERDRRRDRSLQAIGCDVLRFSGSEIYNDPPRASIELYEKLSEMAKQAPRPRRWNAGA
jgi:hypothetical protein